jgi:GNAT superfamily N-acetyltransferase
MSAPKSVIDPEIRAARPQDYPRMAELSRQLGYESSAQQIAARMSNIEGSSEHAVFVAQSPEGRILGWIGLCILHMVEADARAEVSGLVVDENTRSKGIGRRLLERGEQWAREKGCRQIGLRTNVIRERAHAFYERQGYQHTKTQRTYRKNL